MNSEIKKITEKLKLVVEEYKKSYPDVKMDRDYLPFKISEEWGEFIQSYLMLTDRGRQKGKSKDEIKDMMEKEFADIFAYLLLLAETENIDIEKSLNDKWFQYLEK